MWFHLLWAEQNHHHHHHCRRRRRLGCLSLDDFMCAENTITIDGEKLVFQMHTLYGAYRIFRSHVAFIWNLAPSPMELLYSREISAPLIFKAIFPSLISTWSFSRVFWIMATDTQSFANVIFLDNNPQYLRYLSFSWINKFLELMALWFLIGLTLYCEHICHIHMKHHQFNDNYLRSCKT